MINHQSLMKRLYNKGIIAKESGWGFKAENNGKAVYWHTQPRFEGGQSAVAVHAPSDQTDSMTDCNCDIYFRQIKSIISYLTP